MRVQRESRRAVIELYVGMDVSLKETSICVVDGSGEIVSEGTVISEPLMVTDETRLSGDVDRSFR